MKIDSDVIKHRIRFCSTLQDFMGESAALLNNPVLRELGWIGITRTQTRFISGVKAAYAVEK